MPELSSEVQELPLPCLTKVTLGTPILSTSSRHGLEWCTRKVEEDKEDTAVKLDWSMELALTVVDIVLLVLLVFTLLE